MSIIMLNMYTGNVCVCAWAQMHFIPALRRRRRRRLLLPREAGILFVAELARPRVLAGRPRARADCAESKCLP